MKKFLILPAAVKSVFSLMKTGILILFLTQLSFSQIKIEERVEVNPFIRIIPYGGVYSVDSTTCNKFFEDREITIRKDVDTTINVWYGDCFDPFFGGECLYFNIDGSWYVNIEEGFEYVRPRLSSGDCLNSPYYDEDESFNINSSSCLYLKFDKLEPATFETVKIKFTYGTQNGTEFAYYTFNVYKPFFHISLEEPFQTMEYGDYVVVDNFEVLNQCDFVWPWLPDTVSVVKEIIQGSEYCQLWNSYTDEFGTVFTGRDIYIVANGVKPTQDEEIIVRLSTTDPEIDPINLLYIVKPVDLEISVTPSTISPGDTASIIIRKKYLDGTIEDFPEWQTFEIAKLEGCILGDILSESELGPYFYDITQPIKFVTDSLAGSGTVKLKIGVPKFPSFASRPVVLKNTSPDQTERSQTDKEKLQTPPAENPLSSCSTELFKSLLNNDCYLVVGDECDKYKDRPPGLEYIDENVYHINQLGNNENCDPNSEENKLAGGKLETTINKPILSGWGFSPRKSIIEMKLTFDWSYCTDIIMQNFTKAKFIELEPTSNMYKIYNPIENSYRDINGPGEARKIISAFMSIQFSDKMKVPEKLEYYPLPVTKKHELEHVEQHKKEIFINYFTALYLVNHRQPQPNDWCKLSPEEQSRVYDSEDEWYKSTVQKAYDKTSNNLKDETVTKLNEIGAQAVSYFYLKSELIPSIKAQFHLP